MPVDTFPTAPKVPKPPAPTVGTTYASSTKSSSSTSSSSSSTASSGGGKASGGKGGKGGGGGGSDPGGYRARSAKRYLEQAKTLQQQIDSVKEALSGNFKAALDVRLKNILGDQNTQDSMLVEAYDQRVASLKGSAADNEAATSSQSMANLTNAARERANAISQGALQGAGESDMLQTQLMSLRNWDQNQRDITRAGMDTQRSNSASLIDLNVDTKTARVNNATQAESDREQLYNDYFDQREGAKTQLGNLLGQKAELFGYAQEAKPSKATKKKLKKTRAAMGNAYDDAADLSGKAYAKADAPAALREWKGVTDLGHAIAPPRRTLNSTTTDIGQPAKPEGASLRAWL